MSEPHPEVAAACRSLDRGQLIALVDMLAGETMIVPRTVAEMAAKVRQAALYAAAEDAAQEGFRQGEAAIEILARVKGKRGPDAAADLDAYFAASTASQAAHERSQRLFQRAHALYPERLTTEEKT